jgi:hypothetical protein
MQSSTTQTSWRFGSGFGLQCDRRALSRESGGCRRAGQRTSKPAPSFWGQLATSYRRGDADGDPAMGWHIVACRLRTAIIASRTRIAVSRRPDTPR